ncbi:hypothetical protein PMIT1318_02112 [Prochlorococcus marinus str. MIT 1318]|uniref:ShlB/FhaC/HecB family hemolysin secretion/activation protein n=1 Tax=Prochlorococcus TaxID=1218 RepID=UPI0007BBF7A2|nr:ShlB/FhaC/HecB family hemolysin secretion/activation protein [Prochlorococcus marinus]KZR70970.1 hypothetical protein PMIT1318_02112 [Prochlorococcus marinus str. MIT 1318]
MLLLAQLVAPPIQPGPVRLPEQVPMESRPRRNDSTQPVILTPQPPRPGDPERIPKATEGIPSSSWRPPITGTTPYSPEQLRSILKSCGRQTIPKTLQTCAASLTAQLVRDGFVNTRVFTLTKPSPGSLEVVEGRIAELRITSTDQVIQADVEKQLNPLIGSVLHLPTLEKALVSVRSIPGVGQITGDLGRLGSDATQAILNLSIDSIPIPWMGDFSLRNDGNAGTGAYRGVTTVVKNSLFKRKDTFLLYMEVNGDDDPELGAAITSASYTWPLSDTWRLTGSMGWSRRWLVEALGVGHEISFRQFQGMAQLDTTLYESDNQFWSAFASISSSRNDGYLGGYNAPLVAGGGLNGWLHGGYLKAGVNFGGGSGKLNWGGNVYGLQGISGFSTEDQLKELAAFEIKPGEARAVGGLVNLGWTIQPNVKVNMRAAGQWGFTKLPSDMGFGIGSDVGLIGLPGSLISGDSGWMGRGEVVFTAWQKGNQAFQIVPFFGMGGVRTEFSDLVITDTVGSGGLLGRYINGAWLMELGWADSFETNDNIGIWQDWIIGNGLYARLQYRF